MPINNLSRIQIAILKLLETRNYTFAELAESIAHSNSRAITDALQDLKSWGYVENLGKSKKHGAIWSKRKSSYL